MARRRRHLTAAEVDALPISLRKARAIRSIAEEMETRSQARKRDRLIIGDPAAFARSQRVDASSLRTVARAAMREAAKIEREHAAKRRAKKGAGRS